MLNFIVQGQKQMGPLLHHAYSPETPPCTLQALNIAQ